MPEYLVSGRNPKGRQVTEQVQASSADEAVKLLKQRDFTDIVLHTDDIGDLVRRQTEALHGTKATNRFISPADYLRIRKNGTYIRRFLFLTFKLYTHFWWTHILVLAALAIRLSVGRPWNQLDYCLIGLLFLPLAWSAVTSLFGDSKKYDRIIEERSWGRWSKVLALLPTIEGKVPAQEIAFCTAQALAGLGNLDQALKAVEEFADDKRMPLWLYWGRLSAVYAAANNWEGCVAASAKAAVLGPGQATILLGYANALVEYNHDPRRARQVLEEARKHSISDLIAYSFDKCEGMIALEEGRPFEARDHLNQAMNKLMKFRTASALIGGSIDFVHAYLALANAGCGDFPAALQHYQLAEPRLRALKYEDLIKRCETALSLTHDR